MQLGFVSAILPDLSLEEVLRFAAETGYDCVEVMCWPVSKAERRYAGVTHVDVTEFSQSDADRINELAETAGVAISGLGYYPNPLSPDADESRLAVEHIGKVIAAAAMLGVGRMNTFVGRDWTKSVDENWPRFAETWKPLVETAEAAKDKVGIENCPMLFSADEWPGGKNLATTPAIWRRMFEEIPSPYFGLNYDPSHMIWLHMDYVAPLRAFADRLHHLHAKDVRIDVDRLNDVGIMAHPNEYHTPKIPGLGDVDWGRFFSVLTDIGYDGPICVEVEDRAYEGSLELRKASLRQSATYLRNFLPRVG
ncbi:MAG: sugar phosphate isomerase/epimerase [Planctomycetota bacterium]|nr:MAG: sugar phosphate isomerase/epimerase [Planctomycetota bacterium]